MENKTYEIVDRDRYLLVILKGFLNDKALEDFLTSWHDVYTPEKYVVFNSFAVVRFTKKWAYTLSCFSGLMRCVNLGSIIAYMPFKLKKKVKEYLSIEEMTFLPNLASSIKEMSHMKRAYKEPSLLHHLMQSCIFSLFKNSKIYCSPNFEHLSHNYEGVYGDYYAYQELKSGNNTIIFGLSMSEDDVKKIAQTESEKIGPEEKQKITDVINAIFQYAQKYGPILKDYTPLPGRLIANEFMSEVNLTEEGKNLKLSDSHQYNYEFSHDEGKIYFSLFTPNALKIGSDFTNHV
jgi:hypothetical protein